MKKNFKYIFIIFILFVLFILLNANSYSKIINHDLEKNIFRLHILANSNSQEDQELKLKVRDVVIEYIKELCKNSDSKASAIEVCENNLNKINQLAQRVINENNYNYKVKSQIGNFEFPTKTYANIALPSGNYDALRITIGNAQGENWWCSLFPPLCFSNTISGEITDENKILLEENLYNESFEIITQNTSDIVFKFKIIELINSLN